MLREVFCGDERIAIRLPEDARIVLPPEPVAALRDYAGAVRRALRNPEGSAPLQDLVKPSSRVTIAFDDPCIPLPPLWRDVRGRAIEVVLEELYKAGLDRDRVRLVCANGLHRKWTYGELRHLVGRRVWQEMGPERISCHDAEDPAGVVELGKSASGHPVEVNRLVRDSDLLVYVNVNWTSMNGGFKSIVVGLGTFRSIRCHHNVRTLEQGTLMDPKRSLYHRVMEDMGAVVSREANVFTVETVLNNRIWHPLLAGFLSLTAGSDNGDRPLPQTAPGGGLAAKLVQSLPRRARSLLQDRLRSAYQPIAVNAGRIENVHPLTLEVLHLQQNTVVQGQTDALLLALPNLSPYSVFSRINPLLAMNMALGYAYNLHQRRPLVREGGVLILMNPFSPGFHPVHHPSYEDFYNRVLPETRDPQEIEDRFEMEFATKAEYVHRYRYKYAYHGVHPLYVWIWGVLAMKRLGRILVVGAEDDEVVRRLGLTPVRNLDEAYGIAQEILGKGFSLTLPVMPPIFCAEVQA